MDILSIDKNLITALYSSLIIKYVASSLVAEAVSRGRDNAVKNISGTKIKFAQWSTVMEGNPCEYCANKDGEIISVDNPDYSDCQMPVHIHCICTFAYITDEEVDGDGNPIEETWTSPGEDDREKYRIFDIYNATPAQLDIMAEIFAAKGINLLGLIQKRKEKLSGMGVI